MASPDAPLDDAAPGDEAVADAPDPTDETETDGPGADVVIYVAAPEGIARADRAAIVVVAILIALLSAVWAPLAALAWLLPLVVIASLGLGAALWQPALSVRADARGLSTMRAGYTSFTPWSRVTQFLRGPDAFIAERDDGVLISMPWSSEPDVTGIVALALGTLPSIRTDGKPRPRSPFAVLFWIALGVILLAVNHLIATAR